MKGRWLKFHHRTKVMLWNIWRHSNPEIIAVSDWEPVTDGSLENWVYRFLWVRWNEIISILVSRDGMERTGINAEVYRYSPCHNEICIQVGSECRSDAERKRTWLLCGYTFCSTFLCPSILFSYILLSPHHTSPKSFFLSSTIHLLLLHVELSVNYSKLELFHTV
jgi:hypothetical protein